MQVRPDDVPCRCIHRLGQTVFHILIIQQMHDLLIELRQLFLVKARRCPPEAGKIKRRQQLLDIDNRFHRIAGTDPGEQGDDRLRFDAFLAKAADAKRTKPLRQLAFGADQQRFMCKFGRLRAQRVEHLDLHRSIGDMILAAHDMGDPHVDIVDRRGQHIEPAAVFPPDDGIGEQRRVKMLLAPYPVGPGDRCGVIQLEAPVRPAPLFFQLGFLGVGQLQRRPVIDGRLALEVQFLRRFISRIDPARGLQLFQ